MKYSLGFCLNFTISENELAFYKKDAIISNMRKKSKGAVLLPTTPNFIKG